MKKTVALLLLFTLMLAMASCTVTDIMDTTPITYGTRYVSMSADTEYYVFNADKTGYYQYNDARVSFAWRKASNDAVYLFRTATQTGADGISPSLFGGPYFFGEDFMVYSYVGGNSFGASTSTVKYILEGSALDALVGP